MISDASQLRQALEQMERMLRILSTLHVDILPQSRQHFALMAEGPLEEMRRLQQQIEAYVDEALQPLDGVEAAVEGTTVATQKPAKAQT
jgi:hypothetical protein